MLFEKSTYLALSMSRSSSTSNFLPQWTRSLLLVGILFVHSFVPLDGENVMGMVTDDFDFDGLPGSLHEFKVAVPGSREECFYQPIPDGASFYVNFNVIKGGDQKIDFYIRDYYGNVLESQIGVSEGFMQREPQKGAGTLIVCLDNVYNRFGFKLVHLSMMSVVMSHWEQYTAELTEMDILQANFTRSLTSVQESLTAMLQSQTQARFNVIRDWYTVYNNSHYILVWSLLQCGLIVSASLTQVYVVRRLFRTTNVTPTFKPRA